MVHGYQHGHQLLTGSMRLATAQDQDLMLTLTDLSGIVPESTEFKPYITAYPLLTSSYYVLSKTWLDENAERSGCVLTHSLLIDLETWRSVHYPYAFAHLFSLPSLARLDHFSRPITFLDRPIEPPPSRTKASADFCNLYFKEALVPIIWFETRDADNLFWNIISGIWPSLRERFACCTFALDQRRLDERPFDLLFAPKSSYARFKKYEKKHFIQAGPQHAPDDNSPWLNTWNSYLFNHNALPEHFEALMPYLGTSQTDIQKLFAFDSAISAAGKTPMLLLGAMDILESLAPEPGEAADLKNCIVTSALHTKQGEPATQLEFLKLLVNRLERKGYGSVNRNSTAEASQDILRATANAVEDALGLFQVDDYLAGNGFEQAVVASLEKQADTDPEQLMTLFNFPHQAATILPSSPIVASAVVNQLRRFPNERQMHQLVEWLFYSSCTKFGELIRILVPSLTSSSDVELLQLLLERASASDLPNLLSFLKECEVGSSVPTIFAQMISPRFPEEVRKQIKKPEIPSLALALASTYSKDRSGLDELLNSESSEIIVTPFLTNCLDRGHFPFWMRQFMQNDNRIFELLVSESLEGKDSADELLSIICNDVDNLPIAQSKSVIAKIDALRDKPFYGAIRQAAAQSAVVQFLVGDISFQLYKEITKHAWMQEFLQYGDVTSLISLVKGTCRRDLIAWRRAWEWLSNLEEPFYQRAPSLVSAFVDCLLNLAPSREVGQVVEPWTRVLDHSNSQASNEDMVNAFTQCLLFCLETKEPDLSPLVVRTFWEVHSAAMNGDFERASWASSILRIMGWDKAAHIRDSLIDAFRKSLWPPGDFVLAAREPQLLRKLCQRMRNNWTKTDKYLRDALRDLEQRAETPQSSQLLLELRTVIRHPERKDDWV